MYVYGKAGVGTRLTSEEIFGSLPAYAELFIALILFTSENKPTHDC